MGRAARMGARVGKRLIDRIRSLIVNTKVPIDEGPFDVSFLCDDSTGQPATVSVAHGATLLSAARTAGLELPHYCGGQCSCGTCRIRVLDGAAHLSRQESLEQMVLGSSHVAKGGRLACQARIEGPVRVHIPRWS